MNTSGFYANLPALTNLLELADPAHYVPVPDDWYVLITDIAGSTAAIAAGQYREVNLIGASSIIAVLNVLQPLEIPFVFGGDGASLLVPPAHLHSARQALLGVRAIAAAAYGLDLRVGVVPVARIHQICPLKIAKFRLSPLYCQASFIGGGITLATDLIKRDATYRLEVDGDPSEADLTGLECRWQEVPSPHGHTLSLMVAALQSSGSAGGDVFREVFEAIHSIFGEPADYHPVTPAALRLSFNPRKLDAEVKLRSRSPHWAARLSYLWRIWLENLLGWLFMRFRLTVGEVAWGTYKEEVRSASDYQKIDDVLRMVIAGTSGQIQQLMQYLERNAQAGRLAYGLHVSDRAVLTCLILDRRNCHFHLVDAADGGYAFAAQDLKGQLHQKAKNWKTYAYLARQRGQRPQGARSPRQTPPD